MRLAHVSDLHILPPDREPPGAGPTSLDLATAVAADLAGLAAGLDLVVVSGDLTEHADAPSFAAFERIFSRIGLPVVVVPGNHDGPAGMADHVARSPDLAEWDLTNRVVEIGNARILGLNTAVEGRIDGALDRQALDLVARESRRDSDAQLVIVMHHPPLPIGLAQYDAFSRIEGGDACIDILAASGRRTQVLSGHVHRPYTAQAGDVVCHVAGSMIAPYDSALPFGTDPIRPAALQDFYFVHDFSADGRHVVTPQRVSGLAALRPAPA